MSKTHKVILVTVFIALLSSVSISHPNKQVGTLQGDFSLRTHLAPKTGVNQEKASSEDNTKVIGIRFERNLPVIEQADRANQYLSKAVKNKDEFDAISAVNFLFALLEMTPDAERYIEPAVIKGLPAGAVDILNTEQKAILKRIAAREVAGGIDQGEIIAPGALAYLSAERQAQAVNEQIKIAFGSPEELRETRIRSAVALLEGVVKQTPEAKAYINAALTDVIISKPIIFNGLNVNQRNILRDIAAMFRWEDLSPQQRAMIPKLILALFRKDKEASPDSSITTENFFNVVSTPENDRFLSDGLNALNLTVRDFERIIIEGFEYTWVAFRAAGLSYESRSYIPGTGRMVVVLYEGQPRRGSPWTSDRTARILEVLLKVSQSHPELLSESWLKDLKSEELKRKWEGTLRGLGFEPPISFAQFTSKALNIFGNRKELLEIIGQGSVGFERRRKKISAEDALGKVATQIQGIQDEFGLSQAEILNGLKAILALGSSI